MSEETHCVIALEHSKGTRVASLWNPWEGCAKHKRVRVNILFLNPLKWLRNETWWKCLFRNKFSSNPLGVFESFSSFYHFPKLNIEIQHSNNCKSRPKLQQEFIYLTPCRCRTKVKLFFSFITNMKPLGYWMYKKDCVTMAIHGFQKVNASIMWAASVVTTAIITKITFRPTLSTIKPRIGDAGAEMM